MVLFKWRKAALSASSEGGFVWDDSDSRLFFWPFELGTNIYLGSSETCIYLIELYNYFDPCSCFSLGSDCIIIRLTCEMCRHIHAFLNCCNQSRKLEDNHCIWFFYRNNSTIALFSLGCFLNINLWLRNKWEDLWGRPVPVGGKIKWQLVALLVRVLSTTLWFALVTSNFPFSLFFGCFLKASSSSPPTGNVRQHFTWNFYRGS